MSFAPGLAVLLERYPSLQAQFVTIRVRPLRVSKRYEVIENEADDEATSGGNRAELPRCPRRRLNDITGQTGILPD